MESVQFVNLQVVSLEGPRGMSSKTGCDPSWSCLLHLGFFLVHSYARAGLYQFSTIINCRLWHAQKYCYAKVTTRIAIVPLAFHLTPTYYIFFFKTKAEIMSVVCHHLCRHRRPSGARSSIMHLVTTSLPCPVLFLWRNLSKWERYA
jgi:hypothetical protein